MTHIALIGYGRMGREIERLSHDYGMPVVSVIHPSHLNPAKREISAESLGDAEVCLDFSASSAVLDNARSVAENGRRLVVGTTGWSSQLRELQEIAAQNSAGQNNFGVIYSPNFAIDVNLFFRIVEHGAALMGMLETTEPYVVELHHRRKADSPSGTARRLGEIVQRGMPRMNAANYERASGAMPENTFHVASARGGYIPGTHTVGLDNPYGTVEITHTARSREGFARGALEAAHWIRNRTGLYTMDDMIDSMIAGRAAQRRD
ncbi:4-hydroxy-tetrahydrodipicolinate reductase [Candidatus Woesearchaeota archaeon]|nr:4-hydroxy-tetrahydrodipicolinate reductase [Candidatus Woesearchaeota archaeon]